MPRKKSCKGALVSPVYHGSVEALACPPTPNSEEEARWLAGEVSSSIQFVARAQRRGSRLGLERSNPERAAAILTEMAGTSQTVARRKFQLSGKLVSRLAMDHRELLEATHRWRAARGARIAAKASRAFEEKLDRILSDREMLDRTSIREFVMAYKITHDEERTVLAACPTPAPTRSKVTLEDAEAAIEAAKANVT